MIEILAPCGSKQALQSALNSGTDAVYLGLKNFSARKNADNFTAEELELACNLCHKSGVKVYVAMNTLVFDNELDLVAESIKIACESGVDAIIAQDFAVVELVKKICPQVPLHASTQMSVNSLGGALLLQEMGFSRVVLGRELSFEQIKYIAENSLIELEVFVHGALCVCVSGQCYMSACFGERSANRGLCAQPCRLNFSSENQEFALSLKDNSIIEFLPKLNKIGVKSAKIEGRLKRAEYVASAVDACRNSLLGLPYDSKALENVFSRSGFTKGYFIDDYQNMQGIRTKENVEGTAKTVSDISVEFRNKFKRFALDLDIFIKENQPIEVIVKTTLNSEQITLRIKGAIPQKALNKAITEEDVLKQMTKFGGTVYHVENARAFIENGLFMPVSQINSLRRELVLKLDEVVLEKNTPLYSMNLVEINKLMKPLRRNLAKNHEYRCQVRTKKQLKSALNCGYERIYAPIETLLDSDFDDSINRIIINPPVFLADCENSVIKDLEKLKLKGFKSVLCHSLSHVAISKKLGLNMHGSNRLNITNSLSVQFYESLGLMDLVLSIEMKIREMEFINSKAKGIISYGNIPLMITSRSPVFDGKPRNSCKSVLKDKNGKEFTIYESNVSEILNPDLLWLGDKTEDLQKFDFQLHLLDENDKPCEVLDAYQKALECEKSFTRGAYYRGVK